MTAVRCSFGYKPRHACPAARAAGVLGRNGFVGVPHRERLGRVGIFLDAQVPGVPRVQRPVPAVDVLLDVRGRRLHR